MRDLWPTGLPQLAKDTKTIQEYKEHELIPESLEGLMGWSYLRRIDTGDPARRFALVHATLDPDGGDYDQVTFRFQGIVLSAELRPLGTWKE